jgi:hypothetical protein
MVGKVKFIIYAETRKQEGLKWWEAQTTVTPIPSICSAAVREQEKTGNRKENSYG